MSTEEAPPHLIMRWMDDKEAPITYNVAPWPPTEEEEAEAEAEEAEAEEAAAEEEEAAAAEAEEAAAEEEEGEEGGGSMRSIAAVSVPRLPCWQWQCQLQAHGNNSSVAVLARVRRRRFVAVRSGIAEASGEPAPMGQKTRYSDNWLDKAFMFLFASKMNGITGHSARPVADYDDFVAASRRVMQGRDSAQQREVVRQVLLSILPPGAPETFRKLFPPTKWAAEFNAAITVPFFYWLVGPAEVVEVEVNGIKQKSGVHIKKCRYLENSGCVGMCINMCKLPTQDFFTKEFGLPLTMNPNFEDMSCDMVYGQQPPTPEEDPACKQPCYASFCSTAQPETEACPKLPV